MPVYTGTNLSSVVERLLADKINYEADSFFEALYDYGTASALALAMSGTTDKKSKAYKAALRKVDYYKKGVRKPSQKSQEQILQALQQNTKSQGRRIQQIGQLTIIIDGMWRKSRDVRQRRIIHKMNAETAKKFLSELLKNESSGMDYLLFDYGVDDASFDNYIVSIEEF
jgi:hypothetical protein